MGVNFASKGKHQKPRKFLRKLYQPKHCQHGVKWTEQYTMYVSLIFFLCQQEYLHLLSYVSLTVGHWICGGR